MSKLFKVIGIIVIVSAFLFFIITLDANVLSAIFSMFISVVFGLAFISIGDLLDRVDYLESKLKVVNDAHLPQVACLKCGTEHDFDFPKCPKCKYEY